ncbi:hypothetical protein KCU91_g103, partial [Aureobasidium melanogenum]
MLAHAFILVTCLSRTSTTDWIFSASANASNTAGDNEHPEHTGLQCSCRYSAGLSAELISNDTEHQHTHNHAYEKSVRESGNVFCASPSSKSMTSTTPVAPFFDPSTLLTSCIASCSDERDGLEKVHLEVGARIQY